MFFRFPPDIRWNPDTPATAWHPPSTQTPSPRRGAARHIGIAENALQAIESQKRYQLNRAKSPQPKARPRPQ
jgi:hypothetical protein